MDGFQDLPINAYRHWKALLLPFKWWQWHPLLIKNNEINNKARPWRSIHCRRWRSIGDVFGRHSPLSRIANFEKPPATFIKNYKYFILCNKVRKLRTIKKIQEWVFMSGQIFRTPWSAQTARDWYENKTICRSNEVSLYKKWFDFKHR